MKDVRKYLSLQKDLKELVFVVEKVHTNIGYVGKHLGEVCKDLGEFSKLENFQFRMQNALYVDIDIFKSIYSALINSRIRIFWLDVNANLNTKTVDWKEQVQLLTSLLWKMRSIEAFGVLFRAGKVSEIKAKFETIFKKVILRRKCKHLEATVYPIGGSCQRERLVQTKDLHHWVTPFVYSHP